jgi:hypothetical protein
MDQSLENRIRERAYEIWIAQGCVHGQADQHWLAAEREILAASTAALASKSAQKRSAGRLHVRRSRERSRWPANAAHRTRDASAHPAHSTQHERY